MWQAMLKNPDIVATLFFCIAASVGQILHAIKKWSDGEVNSPVEWLTVNLRHTVGAVIGNLGGMLVFIQTGVLGPLMAMPNGMFALILFGFMNGYTVDSGLNKVTRAADGPPKA